MVRCSPGAVVPKARSLNPNPNLNPYPNANPNANPNPNPTLILTLTLTLIPGQLGYRQGSTSVPTLVQGELAGRGVVQV